MKDKDSDLCSNEFFEAFKDVVPIKSDDRVLTSNRTNLLSKQLKRQALEKHHTLANNYLLTSALPPLDPYDHISYRQDGVQQGVFKNLRLGKYVIDSVIQLQNTQFEVARQRIFEQVLHQHNPPSLTSHHARHLASSLFRLPCPCPTNSYSDPSL